MNSTTKFLHLLWNHLAAVTSNDDHLVLFRTAARKPVTGNPVTGWVRA